MNMGHFLIDVFKVLCIGLSVVVVLRVEMKSWLLKAMIFTALEIFLLHSYWVRDNELFGFDYKVFRKVGADVWSGLDPYAPDRFALHWFLNPPTALPLFALFDTVSLPVGLNVWLIFNILSSILLVPLALWVLRVQSRLDDHVDPTGVESWTLPPLAVAGLSVGLTFSDSSLTGLYLGQLHSLAALALLGALVAQGKGRPVLAGVCLSLATVKVGTMLPFLLLFLRRADRRTWITLVLLVFGFCWLTGRIAEWPGRTSLMLRHIQELAAPGMVNDYSFDGPCTESIIGIEPLAYRLGLRDRALIGGVQWTAVLVLGAAVAYGVIRSRLPRPAACALVACYSLLFLYHRAYDAVLLALPLLYTTCRAWRADGRRRRAFVAIALQMIAILYLNAFLLGPLTKWTLAWGAWGRLVQATVLPYATWFLLIVMVAIAALERKLASGSRVLSASPEAAMLSGSLLPPPTMRMMCSNIQRP